MSSNVDKRGVLRGRCTTAGCLCGCYSTDGSIIKCVICNHPPGKHQNLSTSQQRADSSSSQAAASPLSAFPVHAGQTENSPSTSLSSFSIGPRCCFTGCNEKTYFDVNTGDQSPFCQDHLLATSLPFQTRLDNKFDTVADYSTSFTPSRLQNPSPWSPPHHSVSPVPLRQVPRASLVPQSGPPSLKPGPPPSLTSSSSPNLAFLQVPPGPPLPAQQPPVPAHLRCKLPGCERKRFTEPDGKMHDWCGRRHYLKWTRQQEQQTSVPDELRCKTPGCSRQRRQRDDGKGYFDYCGLTCRDTGQLALQPSVSMPSLGQPPDQEHACKLPGCTRARYWDPANGRLHNFCGRTHAFQAQARGIIVETVSIRMASAQELTTVSGKFKQKWAPQKGACPAVDFVFVVTNTKLEQRWKAYTKQLGSQAVEEHYHGTVLACNITNSQALCNDKECGICGISRTGFDRRYIRKNINFQRFGHGFYLAPNSSKCHDYTQGAHSYRALLLCDVAPGNRYLMQKNDQKLKGPPQGYDCVYGQAGPGSCLNYDEIVIHNPDAVVPRYVIVYRKDGDGKIAH